MPSCVTQETLVLKETETERPPKRVGSTSLTRSIASVPAAWVLAEGPGRQWRGRDGLLNSHEESKRCSLGRSEAVKVPVQRKISVPHACPTVCVPFHPRWIQAPLIYSVAIEGYVSSSKE